MKKTFTLFTAFLLIVMTSAAFSQPKISISSLNRGNIMVMIDGSRYNADDNQLMIDNLRPGYHSIKIFLQKKGVKSSQFNNNYQLIYNARLNVKPQYDIDIVINRFGKAFYDEHSRDNGYSENNWADNDPYHADNGNGDNNNWNNNNVHSNNMRPMNSQSFDRFRESLKNESFEETRMNIAKQVISTNWFTTAQVRTIIDQFSFENNKLEIAKYAYRYTVDRTDYFTLSDAFSFSSNKEELMKYMQANK